MTQQRNFQREQLIEAGMTIGAAIGALLAKLVIGETAIVPELLQDKQLLNCKDAAKYVGRGVSYFRDLRRSGKVPEQRDTPTSKPKFFKADLDKYVADLKKRGK